MAPPLVLFGAGPAQPVWENVLTSTIRLPGVVSPPGPLQLTHNLEQKALDEMNIKLLLYR
jgi:hypothetical protein